MKVELRDVNPRRILAVGAGIVVMVVLVFVAVHFGLRAFPHGEKAAASTAKIEVPAPRLQTDPTADMSALRAHDATALKSYGWVDREAGVVRVPIDRAMELTLEKGLPSR